MSFSQLELQRQYSKPLCTLPIPNPPPAPASNLWSSEPREYVKLRDVEECPKEVRTAITIHTLVAQVTEKCPRANALAFKEKPKTPGFTFVTYEKFYELICIVAKAFIKLGLNEGHSVCILGFNSPQWFIANFSAIFAGGLSCGIYSTNTAEACYYVMEDSICDIVLVENSRQLEKVLQVRHRLPNLKSIVMWSKEDPIPEDSGVLRWEDLLQMGSQEKDEELVSRLKRQVPNQCCSLIYTSGTTGDPKGVMLSHDNLTWTSSLAKLYFNLNGDGHHRNVSYLPLSHVAGQVCDIYLALQTCACNYFADPDALRGSLKDTLNEVRPTVFLGVPRVYEKMQEKIQEIGASMGSLKKTLAQWAKSVGYEASLASLEGRSKPWNYFLANKLVLSKAKYALGFDQSEIRVTGAAPITKDTLDFFMSLDMPLMEVYGMSESTGPHSYNKPDACRMTSVGKTAFGVKTKIEKPDQDGNGEICMFGRHVFMGYLRAPQKTKEIVDDDGWLHTGDVGKLDSDNYLYITGRIKEILITAGGENIAPIPIEDRIRQVLPCISNAMLIGDKRKFISVLLAFKTLVDEETTAPKDELAPVTRSWVKEVTGQDDIKTVTQLRQKEHPLITKALETAIKKVNEQSVSRAAFVQKFFILPRDFSLPGGELGPTLKARRPIIAKMYSADIDKLYADANVAAN